MGQFQESARIVKVEHLTEEVHRFTLEAKKIAEVSAPGQFVMVRAGVGHDPLLKRPFSIHQVTADGCLKILFKVVGRGTEFLSARQSGQWLEIIGPLGRGFSMPVAGPLVLVGGGMGIAPLHLLAARCLGTGDPARLQILLGARTARELDPLVQDFADLGCTVETATDDGSRGHHGFVADLLLKKTLANSCRVFACGPYAMMKAVAKISRTHGWDCQVSLETMMACGMGACLGCAIPPADLSGDYLHVCKDGPVLNSREVAWL
jgi:dihydroorotate dehydrogenase electron transfer subunit